MKNRSNDYDVVLDGEVACMNPGTERSILTIYDAETDDRGHEAIKVRIHAHGRAQRVRNCIRMWWKIDVQLSIRPCSNCRYRKINSVWSCPSCKGAVPELDACDETVGA